MPLTEEDLRGCKGRERGREGEREGAEEIKDERGKEG